MRYHKRSRRRGEESMCSALLLPATGAFTVVIFRNGHGTQVYSVRDVQAWYNCDPHGRQSSRIHRGQAAGLFSVRSPVVNSCMEFYAKLVLLVRRNWKLPTPRNYYNALCLYFRLHNLTVISHPLV